MASIWRLVCWCMKRAYVPKSEGGGGEMDMETEYDCWEADMSVVVVARGFCWLRDARQGWAVSCGRIDRLVDRSGARDLVFLKTT
ncbi:hypothetical protein VTI74DRAFT_691 [Chaetomium olivicolor]